MIKRLLLIFFVLNIIVLYSSAQNIDRIYQGNGGNLKSGINNYVSLIDSVIFNEPPIEQLRLEDSINDINSDGPWRFGFNNQTNLNLNNSGNWVNLPSGRIWLLKLICTNAQTINLTLTNSNIPEGCELYFYNEDKSFILGKFNESHIYQGELGTELIPGNSVIIEYFVPNSSLTNIGNLEITTVTHGYRGSNEFIYKVFGQSPISCKLNINCPPGIVWSNQRNSVVMLVSGGNGFCTGALVNNTLNDGKPYVLTNRSCGTNPTSWVFRFNWQSSDCTNPATSPSFSSLSGAILRSNNTATNFSLIEITGGLENNTIPQAFNAFFAGWDNSGVIPTSAFCIEHPFGDIKKISFENDDLLSGNWPGSPQNSYWVVPGWDNGNMDGGSTMGAPLFNSNGFLIGQYHGGQSSCSGVAGSDWFGKFSYSWNPPSSTSANQLKFWLDPNNSGVTSLIGFNALPHVFIQQDIVACDSLLLFGTTRYQSGWYVDTLYGSFYDSIFVSNLTIKNSSYGFAILSTCDVTHILPSGVSVATSGIYVDTIENYLGCDSIVEWNITFLQPSYNTIYPVICEGPYISPSGLQFFTSNIYIDTIQNYLGCDSIITINLTILTNSVQTIDETICGEPYIWNNQSFGTSGTYSQTFQASNGCDSVVILNLTILNNNFNLNFTSNQQLFTSPPFAVQFSNTTSNLSNYAFTWYWGDGTSTTSNNQTVFHEYLTNGLYSVTLQATNNQTGCTDDTTYVDYIYTTGGASCTHSAALVQNGPINACSGQDVVLSCNSSSTFSYQWRRNGVYIQGNNNDTLIVTLPGIYSVIISENGCPVSSNAITVNFAVIQTPVISSTGSIQPCFGGSATLNTTSGFNSYLWSNGATTSSTNVTSSGNYTVQVTNANGCTATSAPYTVNSSILPTQNICVVGVDSVTNNMRVVWEKPISTAIDSFYIYKESTVANVYTQVSSHHYDSLSVWIDPASNPAVQAYRYKLTALDTCGSETPLSDFHKSIHLTINQGVGGAWNLIWSHYEGINFGSYNIFRGTSPSNLTLLTSIQSNLNSYTDLSAPSGNVYYQIEIINPNSCTPTKIDNYSSSKSNIVTNSSIGLTENALEYKVYPNPANHILNVVTSNQSNEIYFLLDSRGRKVLEGRLNGTETHIDLNELSNGVYILKIGEDKVPVRVIKQ